MENNVDSTNKNGGDPLKPTDSQHRISPAKGKGGFLVGNLCILVASIFWGVNVSFTKALIPEWMTSEGISAVRLVGGAILFWIGSMFVRNDNIERSDWKKIVTGGVFGLFGFIYLFVMSLKYANPIDVSIIMTLPPMFVILIGVIFLRQRPSWLEYLGLIVGFAGAVIVILGADGNTKAGSDNIFGDILAILSCICYASYLVILQGPTKKYKPISLLRWVFLFSAIPALFLLIGFDRMPIWHADIAAPWLEIGFILLCPTFIAYFLVQPAIRNIGSELVSLYQYLLPVFATISAVLMGLDRLRWVQVLAMVIIIVGMVLTTLGKKRRAGKPGRQDQQ